MFSRVGFNTEHTQALVYIGSRCGPDCGDLFFPLLEKTGGKLDREERVEEAELGLGPGMQHR